MDEVLTSVHVVQDTTIRLRFKGGGWAFMTFQANPDKNWWNVVISSDWDDWSYGWTLSGMGKDIYSFMSSDREYFRSKFTSGQKDYLYFEETVEQLKNLLTKYGADEEVIDDIDEMEHTNNIDVFYLTLPEKVHTIIPDYHDISDCVVSGLSPRHKYFFDEIFPLFIPEIQKLKELNAQKEA